MKILAKEFNMKNEDKIRKENKMILEAKANIIPSLLRRDLEISIDHIQTCNADKYYLYIDNRQINQTALNFPEMYEHIAGFLNAIRFLTF
jgi:hypothetical protein